MRSFVTALIVATAILSMSPQANAFDGSTFWAQHNRWQH